MKSIGNLFEDGKRIFIDGFAHLNIAALPFIVTFVLYMIFSIGVNFFLTPGEGLDITRSLPFEAAAAIFIAVYIVFIVILTVGQYLSFTAMTRVMDDVYHRRLNSAPLSYFKGSYGRAGKYFLLETVKAIILLTGMAVLVLPGAAMFFANEAAGIFLIALGIVFAVIANMLFAFFTLFSADILIIENKGVWTSIKESFQLVKGNFWAILGRYLVVTIPLFFVMYLLMLISIFFYSLLPAVIAVGVFSIRAGLFALYKHARKE